jgi:DNA repair photolyase
VQSSPEAHAPAVRTEYREEPCRSALNRVRGMPFDWSLNPYMGCAHRCTFCYVRAFERRADRPWDDRYGRSIRVKVNVADVLRRELARPAWTPSPVAVGAATDPYQPAEGRYRLTRACLEVMAERGNPFGIITRGPLVVRDLDVLAHAAVRGGARVHLSIPSLDPEVCRATEPGAAPPRARLRAVARLAAAGIRVSVAMAPILPGISDSPESLAAVVRAARDAGAVGLWAEYAHLSPGTREHFLAEAERAWPGEGGRLAALYRDRAYLAATRQQALKAEVGALRDAMPRAGDWREPLAPAPDPEPPVLARQLGLAL